VQIYQLKRAPLRVSIDLVIGINHKEFIIRCHV